MIFIVVKHRVRRVYADAWPGLWWIGVSRRPKPSSACYLRSAVLAYGLI